MVIKIWGQLYWNTNKEEKSRLGGRESYNEHSHHYKTTRHCGPKGEKSPSEKCNSYGHDISRAMAKNDMLIVNYWIFNWHFFHYWTTVWPLSSRGKCPKNQANKKVRDILTTTEKVTSHSNTENSQKEMVKYFFFSKKYCYFLKNRLTEVSLKNFNVYHSYEFSVVQTPGFLETWFTHFTF